MLIEFTKIVFLSHGTTVFFYVRQNLLIRIQLPLLQFWHMTSVTQIVLSKQKGIFSPASSCRYRLEQSVGFFFTICPFIVTFTLDSWKQHFPATSYSEFMSCISQAAAWTSARMESQLSVAFHCDPSAPENIWDRIQILGYWISGKVPLYWYQTRGVTWFSNGFLEVFWILLMWC